MKNNAHRHKVNGQRLHDGVSERGEGRSIDRCVPVQCMCGEHRMPDKNKSAEYSFKNQYAGQSVKPTCAGIGHKTVFFYYHYRKQFNDG